MLVGLGTTVGNDEVLAPLGLCLQAEIMRRNVRRGSSDEDAIVDSMALGISLFAAGGRMKAGNPRKSSRGVFCGRQAVGQ